MDPSSAPLSNPSPSNQPAADDHHRITEAGRGDLPRRLTIAALTIAGTSARRQRRDSLAASPHLSGPALTRALDVLREGVLFFDLRGRLLAANRVAADLLTSRDTRAWAGVRTFVDSLCQAVEESRPHASEPIGSTTLACPDGSLHLQGVYVDANLFGTGPSILVTTDSAFALDLSEEKLRERFGLSKQQSRVARLLVEGKSNEEIAHLLFISPHTARHHTEHILTKLNIHSRAEIAAAVLRR